MFRADRNSIKRFTPTHNLALGAIPSRPRMPFSEAAALRDSHRRRAVHPEPPLCRFFLCRLSADAGMRNRVICVGIRK